MDRFRQGALALTVLGVLGGSPLFGAVCALFCEPARDPAPPCGGSSSAHQKGATEGPRIASVSQDCCDHDGSLGGATAPLTIRRADAGGLKGPHASVAALDAGVARGVLWFGAPSSAGGSFAPAAPTRSSLVLRI